MFEYAFMWRALAAGLMIGVIAPLIGTFLVSKRYSLVADSLSHVALAGVAIGLLTGIYPLAMAMLVAVVMAVVMEWLRWTKKVSGDTALAMLMAGGLALAVVLASMGTGFNIDLNAYLFGSITTVGTSDLWLMGGLGVIIVALVGIFYKELKAIAFDEDLALVDGLPVRGLNLMLMILTAVTVSLAMRVVGVLLIGALMVIPVVTAMQLRRSFTATLGWSLGFGLLTVSLGLWIAYTADLAAGGTMVLTGLGVFLVVLVGRKVLSGMKNGV